MHIDHINVAAPAELLERVKDFYCDVLGLEEGFRPKFSRDGYWLYSGDKALVHLIVSTRHHPNEKQGYFDHFALRANGLAKMLERLDRFDIEYRTSHIAETSLTQIFCKDPSGTGVEISFQDEPL